MEFTELFIRLKQILYCNKLEYFNCSTGRYM